MFSSGRRAKGSPVGSALQLPTDLLEGLVVFIPLGVGHTKGVQEAHSVRVKVRDILEPVLLERGADKLVSCLVRWWWGVVQGVGEVPDDVCLAVLPPGRCGSPFPGVGVWGWHVMCGGARARR